MKMMSSAFMSRVGLKTALLCHFTPLRRKKVYSLPSGETSSAFGQPGHHGGAAALEIDQAAVDLAVGVERGAGGVDAG
jgi:hypothetical protein